MDRQCVRSLGREQCQALTRRRHFSDACSNSWNRQTFIGNIVDAYDAYGLDGIDMYVLSWLYLRKLMSQ